MILAALQPPHIGRCKMGKSESRMKTKRMATGCPLCDICEKQDLFCSMLFQPRFPTSHQDPSNGDMWLWTWSKIIIFSLKVILSVSITVVNLGITGGQFVREKPCLLVACGDVASPETPRDLECIGYILSLTGLYGIDSIQGQQNLFCLAFCPKWDFS